MRIAKHESFRATSSNLRMARAWRYPWPARFRGDVALDAIHSALRSLNIDDECCTHVLVDRLYGMHVRVIEKSLAAAMAAWVSGDD